MPQSGSTMLGQILTAFIFTFSGGYARTVGDVYMILQWMATIELALAAGTWYVLGGGLIQAFLWKLLGFAFLFWLVEHWPALLSGVRNGFIEGGLLVGGSVLTLNDITDPGNLIDFGFSVTAILFNKLSQLNMLTNAFIIIVGGLSGLIVVLLYIIMAMHLFMALLEYYVVGACVIFLVPFLAYEKTAFIGEGVFSTLISHALRLMIYAAILSAILPILYTWKLPNDPTLHDTFMLLAGSFAVFVTVISAPQMASGVHHGAGVFSMSNVLFGAGSLARTTVAVGAVGAAASFAGGAAVRGTVSGLSAMREAAHMGQAAYQRSHPDTYASRRGQQATTWIGGAQGMAQYARTRVMRGVTEAIRSGRIRAQNTMR